MTQTVSDNGVTFSNTAAAPQLYSIGASVGSNALTLTLDPTTCVFRSATLGSGTPTAVQNGSQLSLVVPSSATLGTTSTVKSRLVLLALNNAGTMELAVVNIAGGNDLTETGLISTTAISAAATANNVIYSASARTAVAYKVVGYVESTQATAGTWGTAPSTIQGAGGQALQAMSSLGYGQTWSNQSSRTSGTTYYNTTGRPTTQLVSVYSATGATLAVSVGGFNFGAVVNNNANVGSATTFVVPAGSAYMASWTASSYIWNELS